MSDMAQRIRDLVEDLLDCARSMDGEGLKWEDSIATEYRADLEAILEPLRWRKWPEEQAPEDELLAVMDSGQRTIAMCKGHGHWRDEINGRPCEMVTHYHLLPEPPEGGGNSD